MTPLYGHTSIDTSYLVTNYPWGFRLRTEKQFWIEFKETQGYRFCSRTKDPRTNKWCAQKNSTYCTIAMCLYLDENEHISYSALTEFSEAKHIKAFVENFPEAVTDRLKRFVKMRAAYYRSCAAKSGSEDEKARYLADATAHAEIFP